VGQIVRATKPPEFAVELAELLPLTEDSDERVSITSMRVLGEAVVPALHRILQRRLQSSSPLVQYHALAAYRDLYAGFEKGPRYSKTLSGNIYNRLPRRLQREFPEMEDAGFLTWGEELLEVLFASAPQPDPMLVQGVRRLLLAKSSPHWGTNSVAWHWNQSKSLLASVVSHK
jgi:hypothetical protein